MTWDQKLMDLRNDAELDLKVKVTGNCAAK